MIFICTPHRGSYLAGFRIAHLADWLTLPVVRPLDVLRRNAEAATGDEEKAVLHKLQKPPTAIDDMDPANPFVRTLSSIPVAPGVVVNSIIAVKGDGPPEDGDDGVVKYKSAHIDGVESELVVRSGHSAQGQPAAIEEVRRILLENAGIR